MRLSSEEIETLKRSLATLSPEARLYLFGSRTDDEARGGDIDLLVVARDFDRQKVRKLRLDFFRRFGEQKLDVLVDDGSFRDPFRRMVYERALPL